MTRHDFVKAALDDCQFTIRALDVKCGALLVLLLAPLAAFGRIFGAVESLGPAFVWVPAAILFLSLWGMAVLTLVRGLAPLDNPAGHIPDAVSATGAYYRSGMYNLTFLNALLNRDGIKTSMRVEDAVSQLPLEGDPLLQELTFEHMKVCYIRDVKMSLLGAGFRLTQWWLVVGLLIYLGARYGRAAA